MAKSKLTKAKDYKCCVCGKTAVAFCPVYEPDIPSNPYCRECLDRAKGELLRKLFGNDDYLKKK